MIGTAVDRYEILEELGHGGMSVVYRGLDSSLEREVAVKVLHNHLAKKIENRKRFHREAKAIARLRHPNILEVYDFSSEDAERSYIVMEYVAGENLRQFVGRSGSPPPEYAALIGAEICAALEHAHDHGIIHRDLKPENVMVSSSGQIKLMDFGIAHVIDAETMTATGSLMGSPAHMAPELIDGEKVDVRADIFALGTVLYWLAAGRLPFEGSNAPQVLKRVLTGDYDEVELVEPRVGAELGLVISKCLARSPADRYDTVADVRRVLLEFATQGLPETEPAKALKSYLLAPDATRDAFHDQIVEVLTGRAKAAQRERNIPLAIGLFNRILAYEPENAVVQQMLDQLCRQDRWKSRAVWLSAAVLLIGGIAAIISVLPSPSPQPAVANVESPDAGSEAKTAEEAAESVADAAAAAAEKREKVGIAVARASELFGILLSATEARLVPLEPIRPVVVPPKLTVPTLQQEQPDMGTADAAAEELVSHLWRFRVSPGAATLTIDGQQVELMQANAGIPLTEGLHVVKARSNGARSWSETLNVNAPGERTIDLEWEPGGVSVRANTSMLVWFNGAKDPVQVKSAGRVFRVPFGRASTESSRRITLRAAPVARPTEQEDREVTVYPGNVQPVTFNFAPGQ